MTIKTSATDLLSTSILVTIGLILSLGLLMIFDTTSPDVIDHRLSHSLYTHFFKQLGYATAGIMLGWGAYHLGFSFFYRNASFFFWLFCFLLLLPLIPGIGRTINGSRRWIQLGGFSFQPSEFMKIIAPLYLIARIEATRRWSESAPLNSWWEFYLLCRPLIIPLVLIALEPNNGTLLVLVAALICTLFLMRIAFRFWGVPSLVALSMAVLLALSLPYVQARLWVFLHPESDLLGRGHQPYQAKIAAGSGGFWGRGIGESWQKLSYLPEAQNDYIAAIFAEEYGFFGICLLLSLYSTLLVLLYRLAQSLSSDAARAYAGVALFLLLFQSFLNLAVVSSLAPSTGLNLPFFSQGGTSLLANSCLIGILLSSTLLQLRSGECKENS